MAKYIAQNSSKKIFQENYYISTQIWIANYVISNSQTMTMKIAFIGHLPYKHNDK